MWKIIILLKIFLKVRVESFFLPLESLSQDVCWKWDRQTAWHWYCLSIFICHKFKKLKLFISLVLKNSLQKVWKLQKKKKKRKNHPQSCHPKTNIINLWVYIFSLFLNMVCCLFMLLLQAVKKIMVAYVWSAGQKSAGKEL